MANTKVLGARGESYASGLLIEGGYKIIAKNFKCKLGEIDLIAIKDNVLVFVEVKTRKSIKYGMPEEAVTQRKLWKISKVGEFFRKGRASLPKKERIDVVSILLERGVPIRTKIIQSY